MPAQLARIIAPPAFEDHHLGSAAVLHHFGGHGGSGDIGSANLTLGATDHQNLIQLHFAAGSSRELFHNNFGTFFNAVLFAARFYNRVHGVTSEKREVYLPQTRKNVKRHMKVFRGSTRSRRNRQTIRPWQGVLFPVMLQIPAHCDSAVNIRKDGKMHNAPQETFSCDILSLSHDGRGVARPRGQDGPVVFVAGGLPGQQVRARVLRHKPRHVEADCIEVLRPAPDAVPPLCPHADVCGGCPLQRMPYAAQLRAGEELLRQTLRRIGGLDASLVAAPLASPLTRGFRNKMEFAFGTDDGGRLLLGQRRRSGHGVVRVPECALMPSFVPRLAARLEKLAAASELPAYRPPNRRGDRQPRAGFWRNAVLRLHWTEPQAPRPDDLTAYADETRWRAAILLLTSPGDAAQRRSVRRIAETLLRDTARLTHIVHEERAAPDGQVRGERRILTLSALPGTNDAARLRLPLLGRCLELDIGSFFQVNTAAAQLLAGLAAHAVRGSLPANATAALKPPASSSPASLLDLYCGAGAPGLLCVDADAHLDGIEYDARATELAARNARALSRKARYLAGDAARLVRSLPATHDVILADPPRAGMDARVIAALERQKASRLIYISCNPATLARDAALLNRGWIPEAFQPVDLFPHTPHLECVSLWQRRN